MDIIERPVTHFTHHQMQVVHLDLDDRIGHLTQPFFKFASVSVFVLAGLGCYKYLAGQCGLVDLVCALAIKCILMAASLTEFDSI